MRKIYVDTDINSRGVLRVVEALKKHKPKDVEIVDTVDAADLVVFHVNGRLDHMKRRVASLNKPYAMIQYALKSTRNPKPEDWLPLWRDAEVVWSYYDLPFQTEFNSYQSPLGVDSEVFKSHNVERDYLICTTGLSYMTESVRECIAAARAVGGKIAHLGTDLKIKDVDSYHDINDVEVAKLFSRCTYVSGLRRIEGFELPAAEGLLCGARPIVFDAPHYRKWFDEYAIFIPEGPRENVIEDLTKIFKIQTPDLPDRSEIESATQLFDWAKVVNGFYQKLWTP